MPENAILNKGAYYETIWNDRNNNNTTYQAHFTTSWVNVLIWWVLT